MSIPRVVIDLIRNIRKESYSLFPLTKSRFYE